MENNLYKQAILDAKAIRAGAIANAKASLEEVIGPKINELVRLNLQEDLEEEDYDDETNNYHDDLENRNPQEFPDGDFTDDMEEGSENLMEDNELDEILAELNSLEEESLEESFDYLSEADEDEDGADDEVDETPTDDTKVVDITLGDLKDILQSVMGGKTSTDMESDEDEESEEGDLNLDEILAELNEESDQEPINENLLADPNFWAGAAAFLTAGGTLTYQLVKGAINAAKGKTGAEKKKAIGDYLKDTGKSVSTVKGINESDQEPINENLLADPNFWAGAAAFLTAGGTLTYQLVKGAINAAKGKTGAEKKKAIGDYLKDTGKSVSTVKGINESAELNEARKTIKSLSSTLNEVNLLNAKLLYVNKIFKEKSLNESQKLKVIKSFDKATTAKEAKNVYEILKESLNTKQKTSLKESIGFASQSRGYIKNNNIIESDPFVSRWQKIAGIKN